MAQMAVRMNMCTRKTKKKINFIISGGMVYIYI
jgi:hypothetical protein